MNEFRYNVGDKVINLSSLSLWDNSIHFAKFQESFIKTVTSATEKYFSVTSFDVTQPMDYDSLSYRHIFKQKDGSCLDYTHTIDNHLYHFVHDHDRIVKFLKNKIVEAFDKALTEDNKEIAILEDQIRSLQNRVAVIKSGGRPSVSRLIPQRQFLKNQEEFILKSLGIEN